MSDEPRELAWVRFEGAFANAGQIPASKAAVIGVAPDKCHCCEERYVVIAAIHPAGFEVSVSLQPDVALDVAQRIVDSYREISLTPGKARQ